MRIIPLHEGNYSVNKNKEFSVLTETSPAADLKMSITPFLVITGPDIVLLDVGLDTLKHNKPLIYQCLDQADIKPTQITKVLLSHLHKDHIEGLWRTEAGQWVPNFPKAQIFLQERELEFALQQTNAPAYNNILLEKLSKLPNKVLMNDDEGLVTNEIAFEVTGGHSPFHQVFWIREADEIAFYGADNLPQRSYLKIPIAYKSDYDGRKAMVLRQEWEKKAKAEHWKILLYHDLKVPVLELS